MKTKLDIAKNWLPRYTGTKIDEFGDYMLLTNFDDYVEKFANKFKTDIKGLGKPMQTATNSDGLSIINFGIGSANPATIRDLLSARSPKGVLFLGKCGGLKKSTELGHFILPTAAIRGSGAELLVGGDLGCLLNIAGRLRRRGSRVRVFHLAEVLAGMTEGPGIGEGAG